MKVCYFVNQYPKVSHSFIRREILALERRGYQIQRVALRGWDDPLPDAEDRSERDRTQYVLQGVAKSLVGPLLRTLVTSPRRFFVALRLAIRLSRDSERPLLVHLIYLAESCRLLGWLRAFGAKRLHAHFGTNSTEVAMLTHALGGPPYSFTVHGPEEFMRPMGLSEKIQNCAFTVAISSFGRSQLYLRSSHENWPKIHVVHCGLERTFYEGQMSANAGPPRVVCVGRLCEAKGQLLLLEAASRLAATGMDFELVLAGDGPMRKALENLIESLRLQSRVRVTGWISSAEVRTEMLAARALVLPSFAEGLPVVIMEAMALRRPVLSTYVAGIPELVLPGENGWLVPAGSIDALETAMRDCLTLPVPELRRMGDAAYARVIARHDIDAETAKLDRLFRAEAAGA